MGVSGRPQVGYASTITAAPWPPPMQAEPSPKRLRCWRRACSRWIVMRVPLAASGCPMAIAPPCTLVLARSSPSSRSTARYCGANASFTSTRSICSSFIPAFWSALRAAGAGPIPMCLGSTPTTAHATSRPRGLRPCALANSSLAITVAAAPSTIPEALPAVTSPSFLKYGLRPSNTCNVVSGRMCSSLRYSTACPFCLTGTGTTSSWNAQASHACAFQEEVVPVPVKQKGQAVEYRKDEHMRPETTLQVLLGLKPYFKKDGLVTAGNASGIVDGAAATVIASDAYAKAHGLKPLGRVVAWAVAGVEPKYMGIGPAPAARKALQKAGMKLEQMDLVEVNEAFAPQYLAVEKELGLDRAKTNVHGGAIAIGHPLAATGTRVTIHLLHALRRAKQGGRFALGSACIGGGQGAAVIVEAFPS